MNFFVFRVFCVFVCVFFCGYGVFLELISLDFVMFCGGFGGFPVGIFVIFRGWDGYGVLWAWDLMCCMRACCFWEGGFIGSFGSGYFR